MNNAQVRIIVPATDSNEIAQIISSQPRSLVFYGYSLNTDETLQFYILFECPQEPLNILQNVARNVSIQVIGKMAAIEDISSVDTPTVSFPKERQSSDLLFSTYYNSNDSVPLVDDGKILFPLSLCLDLSKKRSSTSAISKLTLTANVVLKLDSPEENGLDGPICDAEEFDAFNPVAILSEGNPAN
jgi:hypothetical protein